MDHRPLVKGCIANFGIFLDFFLHFWCFKWCFFFSKKIGFGLFLVHPNMVSLLLLLLLSPVCGIFYPHSLTPPPLSTLLILIIFLIININYSFLDFHWISPLDRFGLVVAKSVHGWGTLSPSHAILPGEQRRSQGSKAVSHCGISTLNKCTSRNVHHYDWQSHPPSLSSFYIFVELGLPLNLFQHTFYDN